MGASSDKHGAAGPPSSRRAGGHKLARVVFVTGKGGVGKTTVAAALAVGAAERDGRSVLVEFGDGESGARVLAKSHPKVVHVPLPAHEAVVRAFSSLFGPAIVGRAVLSNFAVKRFVGAAPAIRELGMLESVRLVAEEHPGAQVFVDMPATGHGVAWLRAPAQFAALVDGGPLLKLTSRLRDELVAKGRCSIVVVTLPERLVVRETLELVVAIERDVELTATRLVVNRFPAAVPEGAVRDARAMAVSSSPLAGAAADLAAALEAREDANREALEALSDALHSTRLEPVILKDAGADPPLDEVARWLAKERFG
ncbi:MAG TPA: ArsA-related P-loop ATPase [Byssovorax sp.]|jgi:anion-transporting  ArsA/GET3 family ATPase